MLSYDIMLCVLPRGAPLTVFLLLCLVHYIYILMYVPFLAGVGRLVNYMVLLL